MRFIWGRMIAVAQEIAPQIALRNCFKELRGKDSIHVVWERVSTCNQPYIFPADFY